MLQAIEQGRGLQLTEGLGELLRRVERWAGGARLRDDLSVLAVEVADGPAPG
jgi:hypothetical protein